MLLMSKTILNDTANAAPSQKDSDLVTCSGLAIPISAPPNAEAAIVPINRTISSICFALSFMRAFYRLVFALRLNCPFALRAGVTLNDLHELQGVLLRLVALRFTAMMMLL